jgi:predicted nucleic acid-binding protein
MIVVDANVAVFWSIDAPLSGKASALLRSGIPLIAPDLIFAEVTNALLYQVRNRKDLADRAKDGLELLPRWFTEIVPAMSLRARAFDTALKLEHPAYDCFYLALAVARDVKLVTADAQFARKCAAGGFGKFVVALENWKNA